MTSEAVNGTSEAVNGGRGATGWRIAVWGTAAVILLLPLIAMQFTSEVNWDETDFIVMGAILGAAGGAIELALRKSGDNAYRAAVGVAILAAFLLIWVNLAVGIIGDEDNAANLMFAGLLLTGMFGAAIARGRPDGMARTLVVMAVGQAVIAPVELIAGWGSASPIWPREILFSTVFFGGAWLLSAWLFRRAARQQHRTSV